MRGGPVIRYALGNLFAKKVRTLLSLVLLTMVLGGTIGLISLSSGMRHTVSTTLSRVEGIVVISRGSADPLFSTLPLSVADRVAALEGVRCAAPEIWGVVTLLDGASPLTKGWFSAVAFGGFDPASMARARGGGLYAKALVEGRFLDPSDGRTVVMSRKLAREYGKSLGDEVAVNGVPFRVVGLYETGSMFLDQSLIMTLPQARALLHKDPAAVSTVYVETEDPSREAVEAMARRIEAMDGGLAAKTKYNWNQEFGAILANLDAFFTAQSLYIALLGMVVVLLTMTMSVMERTREFGILKAVGWTRGDVMRLVLVESLVLGGAAGVLGCAAGLVSARILGRFLPYEPLVPPLLVAVTFAGGLLLGLCGGLYPAWRAASLHPVDALRYE